MYRATKKGGKRHIQRDKILGLKATSSPPHGRTQGHTVCTVHSHAYEYHA